MSYVTADTKSMSWPSNIKCYWPNTLPQIRPAQPSVELASAKDPLYLKFLNVVLRPDGIQLQQRLYHILNLGEPNRLDYINLWFATRPPLQMGSPIGSINCISRKTATACPSLHDPLPSANKLCKCVAQGSTCLRFRGSVRVELESKYVIASVGS